MIQTNSGVMIIEDIVSIGMNDYFRKVPKKSFEIENYDFDQDNFLINHILFTSSQFNIVENFNDKEEFKRLNIRFHTLLAKNEEDVCSPMSIIKVLNTTRDSMFIGMLQNFCYILLRENNVFLSSR